MDIEQVLDRLLEASVSVWLDADGKLRIDKGAPPEIRDLVREHKQQLTEFRQAYALMEAIGVRMIRLPLGEWALAHPPRANLDQIRWAAGVMKLESLALVIDDEGLQWLPYDAWLRRQSLWTQADRERYRRQQAVEEQARQEKLTRRRKSA